MLRMPESRCTFSRLALPALLLAACGSESGKWGKELSRDQPYGKATIYRSAAVDDATAAAVFGVMIDMQYNFASNLPEQIDRVNGRLTLRLGNDNEGTVKGVEANGDKEPVIRYFEGLALQVSRALRGEPVDVVLCRQSLDEPFHTVTWREPAK